MRDKERGRSCRHRRRPAKSGKTSLTAPARNYRNKTQQLLCRPCSETLPTNAHKFSVGRGARSVQEMASHSLSATAQSSDTNGHNLPVGLGAAQQDPKRSLSGGAATVLQSLTTPLTASARSSRQIATIPRARLPTIGDTRSLSGEAHITARKCKSFTVGGK